MALYATISDDIEEYPLTFEQDGSGSEYCQLYAPALCLPYRTQAVNIQSYREERSTSSAARFFQKKFDISTGRGLPNWKSSGSLNRITGANGEV